MSSTVQAPLVCLRVLGYNLGQPCLHSWAAAQGGQREPLWVLHLLPWAGFTAAASASILAVTSIIPYRVGMTVPALQRQGGHRALEQRVQSMHHPQLCQKCCQKVCVHGQAASCCPALPHVSSHHGQPGGGCCISTGGRF